ncbi:GspH/FimT family protein [Roseateles violae]|uniref:Type II secretion system protein H n=1 Tax=Roseateles violae TaxID=3058042 RepID=A0ABT8DS77_9BURK|nr:GspH/FimT family protein [Pelomonas sp. PFR6]MDN3919774.1 GspH/FimT family protein [Pelomonas sp. PFR6]
MRTRGGAGFTLLELAAVLAILAIVLAAAVPSYAQFLQRQQLRGAADALLLDLRHARQLSVQTRKPVFVSFNPGKNWCWGVSSGQPCDCNGGGALPACNIGGGRQADYKSVQMDSAADTEFTPMLGQAPRHGGIAFSTAKGQRLQVLVNGMGRAQQCGPDAVGAPSC